MCLYMIPDQGNLARDWAWQIELLALRLQSIRNIQNTA